MTGKWVSPPDWSREKVFYYKRYQTIGGTTQVYSQKLWDTVWRTEWFYEINRPLNKAVNGDSREIYGWTRRNIFGIAVQCNKAIYIPWFTKSFIAVDRMLDVSLTYFWEKVQNHDHDLVLSDRDHAWTNSSTDMLGLFMKQDMFHSRIILFLTEDIFCGPENGWPYPSLCYVMPGDHWRL